MYIYRNLRAWLRPFCAIFEQHVLHLASTCYWVSLSNLFENHTTSSPPTNHTLANNQPANQKIIQHPPRKTRTTSLSSDWNPKMNSHPPTNEISVGGLGESGPDVAVKIWQIGIFSNHRVRPPAHILPGHFWRKNWKCANWDFPNSSSFHQYI